MILKIREALNSTCVDVKAGRDAAYPLVPGSTWICTEGSDRAIPRGVGRRILAQHVSGCQRGNELEIFELFSHGYKAPLVMY
jgi:hypothetical protein